jgi:hypothetical protein
MTKFLPGWIRNNFRSATGQPVKNQDMIVHLLALLNQRGKENSVRFVHVRAHRGEVGNEGADVGIVCFTLAVNQLTVMFFRRCWPTRERRDQPSLTERTGSPWKMQIDLRLSNNRRPREQDSMHSQSKRTRNLRRPILYKGRRPQSRY